MRASIYFLICMCSGISNPVTASRTLRRSAKVSQRADLKGFNYVNASIQEAMQRFNAAYVTHVNQFTGLRYKDDPAIIAMLLTNENDVTHHFGNALLPDKKVPKHNALYMAQAEKFAAQHGLAKDQTWRSWEHGPSKIFLNDLENRFNGSMIGQLRSLGVQGADRHDEHLGDQPVELSASIDQGRFDCRALLWRCR